MYKLLTLAGLVIISLIPSILLYLLFGELNTAGVKWAREGVQLGGPVAAFIATLWFIYRLYARLSAPSPLQKQLENLEGTWTIEAISHGPSGRTAHSRMEIEVENGLLKISGGVLQEPTREGGTEGKLTGDWSVEIAVFDGHNLVYVYNFSDNKLHENWRGLVRATLDTKTSTFVGTWEVLGKSVHEGVIHLRKATK